MKIEEIDDVPVQHAVQEIARDSPAEQAEADLGVRGAKPEGPPADKDGDQGGRRQGGQDQAPAGQDAPGGAGVADVNDVEEARNDGDRARAVTIGVER